MSNHKKINELLQMMVSMPQAPTITADVVQEYHAAIGHWSDEILDMAVLHYMSTETFFPPAGVLNKKVLDLQLMAVGIPTAAEAWSQVLGAIQHVESVLCDEGYHLRQMAEGQIGGLYLSAVHEYGKHKDNCQKCTQGGLQEVYSHPVVAETVRLLGGRDALFTDNPAADRKQFIDAYRERLTIEGQKFIMPPKIKEFIQDQKVLALDAKSQMEKLTKGLSNAN